MRKTRVFLCVSVLMALVAVVLPTCAADDYYTILNQGYSVQLAVLANDVAPSGYPLWWITGLQQPSVGSVVIVDRGEYRDEVRYYPVSGVYGTVTFYYKARTHPQAGPCYESGWQKVTIVLEAPTGGGGGAGGRPKPVL